MSPDPPSPIDPGSPLDRIASRRPWRRWTPAFAVGVAIMASGLAVAAVTRMPLTWDGAWFLLRTADSGTFTFLHRRAIHALLEAPALITAWVSGDVGLASFAFSVAYAAVRALAVIAAWRVVRDVRPALICSRSFNRF